MKKTTLWHGTSTGEDGRTLRSIFNDGLLAAMGDTRRSYQRAGVHFFAERDYAAMYAQGEPQGKGGAPLLVKVRTELDARRWDLDHEASETSIKLLARFKPHLAAMPAGLLDWPKGHEKVTAIHCTRKYLVVSGERSEKTYSGEAGAFEYKVPWAGGVGLVLSMPAHMLYARLQAMHDYLRAELDEKYTGALQQVLDDVNRSHLPIKYIGETGLAAATFFTQPPGLGYEQRQQWEKLNVPATEKPAVKAHGKPFKP